MNRRISEILYFSIYYFGKHSWKHWLPVKFRLADCLYWIWFYWTNIYQWHFHAHTNLHREVFYTYQRLEIGDSHRSITRWKRRKTGSNFYSWLFVFWIVWYNSMMIHYSTRIYTVFPLISAGSQINAAP